jgi:hypothetical protein
MSATHTAGWRRAKPCVLCAKRAAESQNYVLRQPANHAANAPPPPVASADPKMQPKRNADQLTTPAIIGDAVDAGSFELENWFLELGKNPLGP